MLATTIFKEIYCRVVLEGLHECYKKDTSKALSEEKNKIISNMQPNNFLIYNQIIYNMQPNNF